MDEELLSGECRKLAGLLMDSITTNGLERMGGQLPYRERHPSGAGPGSASGQWKMSRPRVELNAKRQVLAILARINND